MLKQIWYWTIKIVTFNGYFTKKKAQKEAKKVNHQLKVTPETKVDVRKIITSVGGKKNIVSIQTKINSIIIVVQNDQLINKNCWRQLGAKGVLLSPKKITIIFGDDSKAIGNKMKAIINQN